MFRHIKFNALSRALLTALALFMAGIDHSWARSPGQDALDQGSDYFLHNDFQRAAHAFKQAVELDPALLSAWENLGWAYRKLHRDNDALNVWETVLKIEPRHSELLNAAAEIHTERGEDKHAIARYEKSLHLTPQQPLIHLRAGDLYKKLGHLESAVEHYLQAAEDRTQKESAYARIVATYENLGQTLRACEFLEQLAQEQGLSAALKRQLARLYATQGDSAFKSGSYVLAARHFSSAVRWGDDPQYQISLGWALRKQGEIAAAIQTWQRAIDTQLGSKLIYQALGDAYRDLGDAAAAQRWYEKAYAQGNDKSAAALRLAESALQQADRTGAVHWIDAWMAQNSFNPNHAKKIANLYILYDHIDWGIADMTARLTRSPAPAIRATLSLLHTAAAEIAFQKNDYAGAIERYQQALANNPVNADALRDQGWAFWRLQRWDDCQRAWDAFARAYPLSIEPHNLFTQFYLYRKDYRTAIAHATQSLNLVPKQPQQQLKLAKALYLDNQFYKADALARNLAAENPDNLNAQVFHAELISRYQRHAEAKAQWENVLRLNPGSARARFMWLRARYELGEYEAAIAGVKDLVETQGPTETALHWLAEDATARNDPTEAARWMQRLVEFAPERPGYWLDLSGIYLDNNDREHSRATLDLAHAYHPQNVEILQAIAEDDVNNGKYETALTTYQEILAKHPTYRPAYAGTIYSLIAIKQYSAALAMIESGTQRFWKEYEIDLLRSAILFNTGDDAQAGGLLEKISAADESAVYVPILLYHGISKNPRNEKTMYLGQLDSQFKALHDAGYTALTVSEFNSMVDGKQPFPAKPVLITFDDARNDSFELSDPLLTKYGFTATMFVPTAEIIDNHPFYADWSTLKKYQNTRRWDFQSHGHRAHELIQLDSSGNTGGFLVNREWLPDLQRLETTDEYVQRLDEDYFSSMRLLLEKLPGPALAVYAFPYSEAGQQRVGNAPESYDTNLRLLAKHFRFGAIQDQSGYNLVNVGRTPSLLLRRFAVPRTMDGSQLLQHLAEKHPGQLARLARAEMVYWQGRYSKAQTLFENISTAGTAPEQKKHYFLASIASHQGRDRTALKHITAAVSNVPDIPGNVRQLRSELLWANRPSVSARMEQFHDSDRRESEAFQTQVFYPLENPVNLSASAGETKLHQPHYAGLTLNNVNVGTRWHFAPQAELALELRAQNSASHTATTGGHLQMNFETDLMRAQMAVAREDVMTLPGWQTGLQVKRLSGTLDMRVSRFWSARVAAVQSFYDDDNTRRDLSATAYYSLPQLHQLRLGLTSTYSDTRFSSPAYYSPRGLRVTEIVAHYRDRLAGDWSVSGQAGAGRAADEQHAKRNAFNLSAEITQNWSEQLRLPLTVNYQNTVSYRSLAISAGVDYRF
ncbi:MAG: tetratricopeptide repeat protein [Gammaproteobacteria bacterium]|nr:tetratricopeptide repeat protein [Gammaproteobacteria bacterium]